MPSQIVAVGSKVGLHARPATILAKAAAAAGLAVTIGRPGEKAVNAGSLLSILALGVKNGDSIEVTVADGDNADSVLTSIVDIIATDHDE
ncbi:MAG: HPr family phosphocarrier protein [Candidatus Planktophila sp.]